MASYWVLDKDHRTVPVRTVLEWALWFEKTENRIVAKTQTKLYLVSTMFMGIDMGWGISGPPILFETMVFDRKGTSGHEAEIEGSTWRYSTWDDAEAGHKATVRRIEKLEEASGSLAADLEATTGK